ncbi:MAG: undecaprenyldiphospho-muramoylpentapeptide beta-N-acetylglucosaminyltransferase, partial [Porphyromonadaceae bacterium]|nr:undecaprenyldiphospho-muramoylpentapeptide beta-N-acetylglucosaminyltransferase [Porphyromonadaceae bacterium]
GFSRQQSWKTFRVSYRLVKSRIKANAIVRAFHPDIVVGVGGYASGPTLWAAARRGVPTLIQEQNSYAGVTNKLLASKAKKICVAYEHMERFFPADRIVLTGNPVRQALQEISCTREEAIDFFGLNARKKTILVVGGSLGARTINQSVLAAIDRIPGDEVQLIWQTGKYYEETVRAAWTGKADAQIVQMPFLARRDLAYKAADLVISRAGAASISELCLLGKPAILVPSPNVAEDHQTKNALALSEKGAALLIPDKEAVGSLIDKALELVKEEALLEKMHQNILSLAQRDSASRIADIILEIVEKK